MMGISRRKILAGTGAVIGAGVIGRRAQAAEFKLKYGNDLPATHPINKRAAEACDAIRAATNGRVDIQIFPNSQLGGSTDMLSQVRSGALDIFTVGSPLANLIPVSAIPSIAFAFPNFDGVWAAVDGDSAAISAGRSTLSAWWRSTRCGTTASARSRPAISRSTSPNDLKGLKIARAGEPAFHLDVPRARHLADRHQLRRGLYGAADQDRGRAGNPLALIDAAKFYEVQKYCSLTGHMWEGFWMVANKRNWEQLPQDLRNTTARLFNEGAVKQREDMAKLNATLESQLKGKGLTFNNVNKKPFQAALKTAGFYSEWRRQIRRRCLEDP